ncbi:MAG: hypothetical protein ABJX32_06235 [Tateyamaria sp.]
MATDKKPTKLLLTDEEREMMKAKADEMGVPLATWIRITCLKAAKTL